MDLLWNPQPVKADKRICNNITDALISPSLHWLVAGFQTENPSRSCIENWLKLAHQVGRKVDQYTIAVVQSVIYKGNHHHLAF